MSKKIRKKIGSLGGKALVRKYGKDYMTLIGKKGYQRTCEKILKMFENPDMSISEYQRLSRWLRWKVKQGSPVIGKKGGKLTYASVLRMEGRREHLKGFVKRDKAWWPKEEE